MKTYEIVNPSDSYTMQSDNLEAAFAACTLLGSGKYTLTELGPDGNAIDNGPNLPMFLFASEDVFYGWWKEYFGRPFEEAIQALKPEICAALESVLIGSRHQYERLIALVPEGQRDKFREEWQDSKRSSMNDIGGCAYHYAKQLRKQLEAAA